MLQEGFPVTIDLGPSVEVFRAEIDAFYAGFGSPTALERAFRDAVLLVPLTAETRVPTYTVGGVQWVCAFTSAEEYALWLSARDELGAADEYPYQALSGWRLADYAVSCANPTGVSVDIAGSAPMAFPPTVTEQPSAE